MATPAPDDKTAEGMSGAHVVLAILGALAVVVGIVLIAFTAFEPESAPCASGDMATNPLSGGVYQSRTELFTNVRDAEAFICRGVPELGASGWSLERIEATRSVPIEFLVEGDGIGYVTLGYLEEASGRALTIDSAPFFSRPYFVTQMPEQRTEEPVRVRGIDGVAYRYGINPDQVDVQWREGTLEHRATVMLGAGMTLDDLIEVLNTLR